MPRSLRKPQIKADPGLAQAKVNAAYFRQLLKSGHGGGHGGSSVREAHHKGHHISIETRYVIKVDGKVFRANISVANAGDVHYHAIPTVGFASAVDLIKCVIDVFPGEFDGGTHIGTGHAGHSGAADAPRHQHNPPTAPA